MSAPLLPDLVTRYYTDKAAAENAILIWHRISGRTSPSSGRKIERGRTRVSRIRSYSPLRTRLKRPECNRSGTPIFWQRKSASFDHTHDPPIAAVSPAGVPMRPAASRVAVVGGDARREWVRLALLIGTPAATTCAVETLSESDGCRVVGRRCPDFIALSPSPLVISGLHGTTPRTVTASLPRGPSVDVHSLYR